VSIAGPPLEVNHEVIHEVTQEVTHEVLLKGGGRQTTKAVQKHKEVFHERNHEVICEVTHEVIHEVIYEVTLEVLKSGGRQTMMG
jgi:hypothetical protein